jgi:hypothetical protein
MTCICYHATRSVGSGFRFLGWLLAHEDRFHPEVSSIYIALNDSRNQIKWPETARKSSDGIDFG